MPRKPGRLAGLLIALVQFQRLMLLVFAHVLFRKWLHGGVFGNWGVHA